MTAETRPPTDTPRPQEKALTLFLSVMKLRDNLAELQKNLGQQRKAKDLNTNLSTSMNLAEQAALNLLATDEKEEYIELQIFARTLSIDPRGGIEVVKGLMQIRGYTPEEIDSFIQK